VFGQGRPTTTGVTGQRAGLCSRVKTARSKPVNHREAASQVRRVHGCVNIREVALGARHDLSAWMSGGYATLCLEFGKELADGSSLPTARLFQSLADALVGIGAGRYIKQPLVGLGVLDDGLRLALDG
jgi:hypothetical protein